MKGLGYQARIVEEGTDSLMFETAKLSEHYDRRLLNYQFKRYCLVLVAQQGDAQCIYPLSGAFLRDQNRIIPTDRTIIA